MSRILLVEGDVREAVAMRAWFARSDEVSHAPSALDAIRAAGEGSFDVALVDADLPDARGLEILGSLRLLAPGARIVLLAQAPSAAFSLEALSRGATAVLRKGARLEREVASCLRDTEGSGAVRIETLAPVDPDARAGPPRRTAG